MHFFLRARVSLRFRAVAASWLTHIYIVACAALIAAAAGAQIDAPQRELLNSERIAATFGSYGVDVLAQDDHVRVSSLYSTVGTQRICRTFAVVRYTSAVDPDIAAEHAAIVAGGSIGAVFAASGWQVRKAHLRYGQRAASPKLAALMAVAAGTPLAEHLYVLDVVKDGRAIQYAALVELHHPEYLDVADLARIYGVPGGERDDLIAALLEIAAERTR